MPGTPSPVGQNQGVGPFWNAVIQAIQQTQGTLNGVAGRTPGLGSQNLVSAANASVFTPTTVNDQELMSSPTVTAQVGTSGQVLLLVTSLITVTGTNGNSQIGLLYYSYTPKGGSQVGPGTNVIAKLETFVSVSGTPLPTVTSTNAATVAGAVTIPQLPAGLITFNLWAEANGPTVGASFQSTEMIVWPL